jgi:hypothetical protein
MTDDRGRMTAKFEIRSTKSETNSNERNSKVKNFVTEGTETKMRKNVGAKVQSKGSFYNGGFM